MFSHRRLRRRLTRVVLGALLLGVAAAAWPPKHELFPFFCWFLFPIAPGVEERYALELTEVEGHALPSPRWLEELGVLADPWAMDAHWTIQALGRAIEADDEAAVERLRERLEANFLPTPATYSVARVRFDVLERWHTGRLRSVDRLAWFETDAPPPPWLARPPEPGRRDNAQRVPSVPERAMRSRGVTDVDDAAGG